MVHTKSDSWIHSVVIVVRTYCTNILHIWFSGLFLRTDLKALVPKLPAAVAVDATIYSEKVPTQEYMKRKSWLSSQLPGWPQARKSLSSNINQLQLLGPTIRIYDAQKEKKNFFPTTVDTSMATGSYNQASTSSLLHSSRKIMVILSSSLLEEKKNSQLAIV